jgi:deoxyribonuclease-4
MRDMTLPEFRFGTVGAPKSQPKTPGGSVGAILHLRSMALNAFELGWVRSVRISEKTCAVIKATAQNNDVALSIHAPYYINLNADDEEWPKSRKRLMDAAHYGYLAGATDIIFHPGSYFGKLPEQVMPLAIERLNGCITELRAADNPVILRPETMGKAAMLGSLGDILLMSQSIEGVEPCLDFPHLHARTGDGRMNSYGEWVQILERYRSFLGKAALQCLHIHLSGIEYGPKGEREHLPLEESDLDLDGILQALFDLRCGGRIVCESPVLEEDAILIKNRWAKVVENPKDQRS